MKILILNDRTINRVIKMKKAFHDKLEVKLDEKGRPLAFSFRRGTVRRAPTCANGRYPVNYKVVDILSWWREPGAGGRENL